MQITDIAIERINRDNYHMFDDMVFWRIDGFERTDEQKEKNKNIIFERAFSELEHQDFYIFAVLYGGCFVGWITLIYIPKVGKWNRGVIFVDELWTAPKFRRRGIAIKLMQKASEIQNETGAVKVRLYTDNIPAQELYKKCGFKTISEAVFMESYND